MSTRPSYPPQEMIAVEILATMPEDVSKSVKAFLKKNPDWDLNQMISKGLLLVMYAAHYAEVSNG